MKVTVNGVISRGVKSCSIDDNGHLIFTMTDESTVDLGRVNGNGIADISFKETDSQGNNVYTMTMDDGTTEEFKANRGAQGIQGIQGETGDTGVSVTNYELISGSHSPGTYDTYRMTLSDGTTFDCQVWNGANGEGSGDMMATIYDSHGKSTDVFDYVDNAIASIPTPDVSGQINAHNESETAHNDIRTGKQDKITASGLLKGDGSGGVTPAVAGTDYQTPLTTEGAQTLGIDATPTSGSNNLVTSDGVYTSLQKKADSSSVYTKSESISAETRTALSLAETATPDAALAEIARQLSESGGLKLIKLWENASPTSEFQAHSVTFDASSSKAFIVSYKPHADAAYDFVLNAILVGKNNAVEMQSVIGSGGVHIGGMVIGVRKVTVTETGATFDSAYFVSTTDSFTAHTKFCIPTVIYGIE